MAPEVGLDFFTPVFRPNSGQNNRGLWLSRWDSTSKSATVKQLEFERIDKNNSISSLFNTRVSTYQPGAADFSEQLQIFDVGFKNGSIGIYSIDHDAKVRIISCFSSRTHIHWVRFNRQGGNLYVCYSESLSAHNQALSRKLGVLDLKSESLEEIPGMRGVSTDPSTFDMSSDGRLLGLYCQLSTGTSVVIYDTLKGRISGMLSMHEDMVREVKFSPNDQTLATIGSSMVLHLSHVETGRMVAKIPLSDRSIKGIHFTPDGSSLILPAFHEKSLILSPTSLEEIDLEILHSKSRSEME